MKLFKTLSQMDQFIFLVETYIMITLLIFIPIIISNNFHITNISDSVCYMYSIGYHCPACGGTRAVDSLIYGNILKSFFYMPMVPYVFYVIFSSYLGYIIYFITHGNKKIFNFNPQSIATALFIMMIYFYIKNFIAFFFGFNIYSLIE